jgi:hypothetical protein
VGVDRERDRTAPLQGDLQSDLDRRAPWLQDPVAIMAAQPAPSRLEMGAAPFIAVHNYETPR